MAHAAVNPEMLRWARDRAGLHIEDVQITASKRWLESLHDWEIGKGGPTFEQARALSKILRVPLGYLFLDSPPAVDIDVPDLRTVGDRGSALTLDLTDTVLDAQHKQAWLSEYRKRQSYDPLPWVGISGMAEGHEAVAKKIGSVLRLEQGWRREAKNWENLHSNLVLSAERAGVIVLQSSMVGANSHRPLSVEEFRGFALVDKFAPLVFINTSDHKPARLFTLIHELTHIVLSVSGISNAPLAQEGVLPLPDIERFCNAVAAEFLMPKAEFIRLWDKKQPFDANVRRLSLAFKVSQMVAARGAFDAGLVSANAYWPFIRERIQLAKDKADKLRESDGGPGGVKMVRIRNGEYFVKVVTQAAKSGDLPYRDAARLLNVKPVTLGKLGT
jgi:Zn-dependent peptidase ImmA (M78 family)/transcriptional regulator with XRE-family HTH domain